MSFSLLRTALSTAEARALHTRMSLESWLSEQEMLAGKVTLFREYAEGDHRAELTDEMRRMLRIGYKSPGEAIALFKNPGVVESTRFNDNYMDIVIQTMVDRLKVTGVESDTDAMNEWIGDQLERNRFDGLQVDTHEAAVRDSITFVMSAWDRDSGSVKLSHEPAFDGVNGMLAVFAPDNSIQVAIKVWHETRDTLGDTTRLTLYYADRIEKWVSFQGGDLRPYQATGEAWPMPTLINGEPVGVAVVPFTNRGTNHNPFGLSEIENVIPLQDALNRTLYSMVMTAELTGFGIRYAVGWKPPAAVMPGDWIAIKEHAPLGPDEKIDIGMLQQGEIMPYIAQAQWLTGEIGKISRTPAPEFMGSDNASGESLKQREIGLIGKVQRFQVKAGNQWENLIRLAWRTEAAFKSAPPAFTTLNTKWDSAEIRNDTEVIARAQTLDKMGYHEEALRQMAPVFEWNEDKIQGLLAQRREQEVRTFTNQAGNPNVPNFQAFRGLRVNNGNQVQETTN